MSRERSRLATPIPPVRGWKDVSVPEQVLAQLQRIARDYEARRTRSGANGRLQGSRRGMMALFTGAPGNQKSAAAAAIAQALQVEALRTDLGAVTSRYIGETEKNLDRILSDASSTGAVLLLDDADGLFGDRSEATDAHDRQQAADVQRLLQRIEAHPGLVLLASNRRRTLDQATVSSIAAVVDFE